ncbi:MAG: LLM class F420-dependent oxidoreductase [Acidimicrobiia bacterium]
MELGRVGIWTGHLDLQPIARIPDIAAELEGLGHDALWIPEVAGRDPFVNAALLLGGTERLVVATGIATIYSRDPIAMSSVSKTLTDAFPGRFLLGLGVSHQPAVEGLRKHTYGPPLTAMREYLDGMDAAPYFAAPPRAEPVRALAALGPKMLALAAERAVGAHPYFVPVEHTAVARDVMGPDAWLMPEQMAVLETDAAKAREIARKTMATYLGLPNYVNNLRRLGWTDDDLADGGSDRLVDAIVVWGDEAAVRDRCDQHFAAGADHVCVQVLPERRAELPIDGWRRLAPALLG